MCCDITVRSHSIARGVAMKQGNAAALWVALWRQHRRIFRRCSEATKPRINDRAGPSERTRRQPWTWSGDGHGSADWKSALRERERGLLAGTRARQADGTETPNRARPSPLGLGNGNQDVAAAVRGNTGRNASMADLMPRSSAQLGVCTHRLHESGQAPCVQTDALGLSRQRLSLTGVGRGLMYAYPFDSR